MEERDQPVPEQDLQQTNKRKAEWFNLDEEQNPYVYVSGLPNSMTEDEFLDLMKRYGIIAKKAVHGQPFNIKMYKDELGHFKGDATCCYARVESVGLAILGLDGYQYDDNHVLQCQRAKFELKGQYDPKKKPRPLDKKAKLKHKKKLSKILSWEPSDKPVIKQNKAILKYMFTPEEILEDATLMLELKEDIEAKCTELKIGEPKRIDIYDKHPDGVIAVTFAEPAQAEACIKALDNEFYAGRIVNATLWDGKTKYKIKETDEESEKRLEKWHKDLEKSDDESDMGPGTSHADRREEDDDSNKD